MIQGFSSCQQTRVCCRSVILQQGLWCGVQSGAPGQGRKARAFPVGRFLLLLRSLSAPHCLPDPHRRLGLPDPGLGCLSEAWGFSSYKKAWVCSASSVTSLAFSQSLFLKFLVLGFRGITEATGFMACRSRRSLDVLGMRWETRWPG